MNPGRSKAAAAGSSAGSSAPAVPIEISGQVCRARSVLERHLATTLQALHLFGSALQGGLKPFSDIDLLATVRVAPDEPVRHALLLDLLAVSAPPGGAAWRALEVTVVAHDAMVPWRYPARRELQFGEWLRQELLDGVFEPACTDSDLAILLTQARQCSVALLGPPADSLFEPVSEADLRKALAAAVAQWKSPADWAGDERNVVLALARIWYSASTGRIAAKDVAAAWLLERVAAEHKAVLHQARAGYLGIEQDGLAARTDAMAAFVRCARSAISDLLGVAGQ